MKCKIRAIFSTNIARVLLCVVAALIIFFSGYQLAIYQSQNDDSLLPHFNIGSNSSSSPINCTGGLPEDCCQPGKVGCMSEDKPVIYLYPVQPESVNVKLSYIAGFSKTVPEYPVATGWQVFAQPNGTLRDAINDKTYPYLFWEGKPTRLNFNMSQGFVVSGQNTKPFLEQKLTALGLNQNESTAFLAYWLPKMQNNTFNLIHFAGSEYTNIAPLTITPKPDSLLRVNMVFEVLQKSVAVTPQSFPTFHRTGFTVVEWGGTEL